MGNFNASIYIFTGYKIEIKELEENGINIYNNESYY
jgi:hypothetical protein